MDIINIVIKLFMPGPSTCHACNVSLANDRPGHSDVEANKHIEDNMTLVVNVLDRRRNRRARGPPMSCVGIR